MGLFGCWRTSTCMQNDEIAKLTCYMVGILFPVGAQSMTNSIQLAACGANEHLPSCPDLPADIFTSCLTSLINVALRYFIIMNHQQHYCRHGGATARRLKGSSYPTWRTQLDFLLQLQRLSCGLPFREKPSRDSIAVAFSLLSFSVTSYLPNVL